MSLLSDMFGQFVAISDHIAVSRERGVGRRRYCRKREGFAGCGSTTGRRFGGYQLPHHRRADEIIALIPLELKSLSSCGFPRPIEGGGGVERNTFTFEKAPSTRVKATTHCSRRGARFVRSQIFVLAFSQGCTPRRGR